MRDAELLIMLEGDDSDVDLHMSDDELDLVSYRNEHAVPPKPRGSRTGPGNDRSAGGGRIGFE